MATSLLSVSATGAIALISVLVLMKGWTNTHAKTSAPNIQVAPQSEAKKEVPVVIPSGDAVLNEVRKTLDDIKKNTEPRIPKKLGPPFAAEIDCAILTPTPKDTGNGFWIGYKGLQGLTRTPAQVTVHIRLTNLQSSPAMISKYSIKMDDWKMTRISAPQVDVFFSGCAKSSLACWLDDDLIIDKQLVGLNLQPRIPVQGWTLLEYPLDSAPTYIDPSKANQI